MISCKLYDQVELVCLYQYGIRLVLKSGQVFEGKALDTCRDDSGREAIKIEQLETQNKLIVVALEEIKKMEALTDNPHFQEVCFD